MHLAASTLGHNQRTASAGQRDLSLREKGERLAEFEERERMLAATAEEAVAEEVFRMYGCSMEEADSREEARRFIRERRPVILAYLQGELEYERQLVERYL